MTLSLLKWKKRKEKLFQIYNQYNFLNENHPPWRGEGAVQLTGFNKVYQRGELNWVSQLQPSC